LTGWPQVNQKVVLRVLRTIKGERISVDVAENGLQVLAAMEAKVREGFGLTWGSVPGPRPSRCF
jgi:hypothetical protein